MGLLNNTTSEFDSYIAEEEKLIGTMRVSCARSFGDGYDCGVEDKALQLQDEINQLENQCDLFEEINQELEARLKNVSSFVGKALNKCK